MIRRPPRSTRTDTLFPYTALFRSEDTIALHRGARGRGMGSHRCAGVRARATAQLFAPARPAGPAGADGLGGRADRTNPAGIADAHAADAAHRRPGRRAPGLIAEERRVGKECVRTF